MKVHLSSFTAQTMLTHLNSKLRPSLEPQFQLLGQRAGYCFLVREKHWSVSSFLYGNLLPTCPQSGASHPWHTFRALSCAHLAVQALCRWRSQPPAWAQGSVPVPVPALSPRNPLPAPHPAGTQGHTGLAHCDQHICTGQGTPGTICQEMAREHNPGSVTGTGSPGEPKALRRDSHRGQLATWHPKIPSGQSGNFTLGRAVPALCQPCLFPRFAEPRKNSILPGEGPAPVSTAQHSREEPLSWKPTFQEMQPNSTDVSALNYSWSEVQIFPFLSCVLLPETHTQEKKPTVQDFYPSKIIITLQPYYYN